METAARDIQGQVLPPAAGWVRLALVLGITAPLLLAGVAIIGGALHPGYRHVSQAISELTAVGAVNKPWLDAAMIVMQLMTLAFGLGYARVVAGAGWRLRLSAWMMIGIGLNGLLFARFPMDVVGTAMTFDGRMHLLVVSIAAILAIGSVMLAGLGWRGQSRGRGMGRLCWLLLAVMLFGGVAAAVTGINGWPGIGIWQRVNNAAFGLFQIATAAYLLRLR